MLESQGERSSGGRICPMNAVPYAPMIPIRDEKMDEERHDGNQTQDLGQYQIACRVDTHDVWSASICLGYWHGTQLEAMLEPTFPARMRHMILEENSSNMISRAGYNPKPIEASMDSGCSVSSGYR